MKTKYEDAIKHIKNLRKGDVSEEHLADFYVKMGLVEPKEEEDLIEQLSSFKWLVDRLSNNVHYSRVNAYRLLVKKIIKKLMCCENCEKGKAACPEHSICTHKNWKMRKQNENKI